MELKKIIVFSILLFLLPIALDFVFKDIDTLTVYSIFKYSIRGFILVVLYLWLMHKDKK